MAELAARKPDVAPDRGRRRLSLTARDRELLEFLAEHRLALADHLHVLLRVSPGAADARLRALADAGYLTREPIFHRQPSCIQIARKGLAAIGSELPTPRLDLRSYQHDVGVAWLWLAARGGTFGSLRKVIGERRLRSHDASTEGARNPLGVRLGGVGPRGRERMHYPDLLLVTPEGKRIAVELELSWKGPARTERILAGYAADASVAAVLYLVENRAIGRSLEAAGRRLGISDLVQIQLVRGPAAAPGAARTRIAQRARHSSGWESSRPGSTEVADTAR